jgi:hypothetical protein
MVSPGEGRHWCFPAPVRPGFGGTTEPPHRWCNRISEIDFCDCFFLYIRLFGFHIAYMNVVVTDAMRSRRKVTGCPPAMVGTGAPLHQCSLGSGGDDQRFRIARLNISINMNIGILNIC